MENLILSFQVILPICLMIALGYFLKRIHLYDDKTLKVINNLVFRVFLPIMLFYNLYQTHLERVFQAKAIVFAQAALAVVYLVLLAVVPLIEKENRKRGVLVQGIFRSNFLIFGLPVVMSLYENADFGFTTIMIAIVVPTFNVLSVVALEVFRGGKPSLKSIAKGIATNPLILASLLGVCALLLKVRFPAPIEKTLGDLSKVATPLALVVLGGSFTFQKIKGYAKQLVISVAGRLILVPGIFVTAAIVLGYRQIELATFLAMFASPTAVSSFTMAQQMGGDGELAGQIVVFTSVLSVLTMFLWIFLLKQAGMM